MTFKFRTLVINIMKLKLTYLFIIILILSSISTCFTYAEETSPKLENKDISTLNTFNITLSKPDGFLYLFDIPIVSLPPMPFDAIIIGSITNCIKRQFRTRPR